MGPRDTTYVATTKATGSVPEQPSTVISILHNVDQ